GASIAATAALAAGQPFGVDWTTADNTILTLDAAGVIDMHMAMVTRVATLHAVATALKDAAMSCTTVQELRGIDIATWPSV
ncbi:DUF4376 domain-containing protein, partial [Arthrospira platensis SPKY1]|nr:DUF4376 domain-containing protein [Arthrospira platensis SPKY1]